MALVAWFDEILLYFTILMKSWTSLKCNDLYVEYSENQFHKISWPGSTPIHLLFQSWGETNNLINTKIKTSGMTFTDE